MFIVKKHNQSLHQTAKGTPLVSSGVICKMVNHDNIYQKPLCQNIFQPFSPNLSSSGYKFSEGITYKTKGRHAYDRDTQNRVLSRERNS